MKKKNIKYTILETSYSLFQQYGYHNVSVLQICQACQISKPTFYKHIGSKQNILSYYFQSIDNYIDESWYRYDDNINYTNKILEGFEYLIQHILTMGINLYTENFIANLTSETQTLKEVKTFHDSLCDLFQAGQKAGQIQNPATPEQLYTLCMHLLSGCGAAWCMSLGKTDLKQDFMEGIHAILYIQENHHEQ